MNYIDVKAVFIDGSNPTRSETPLAPGWHYQWREHGEPWITAPDAYETQAQALAAGFAWRKS